MTAAGRQAEAQIGYWEKGKHVCQFSSSLSKVEVTMRGFPPHVEGNGDDEKCLRRSV